MHQSLHRLTKAAAIGAIAVFVLGGSVAHSKDTAKPVSDADIKAREEHILGKPPKILPLKTEELTPEAAEIATNIRKGINLPPAADMPEFFATMLRHPELFRAHSVLAVELFKGALTVRDRELAILRTGWLCQAPYEFGSHVKIGRRLGNITEDEVARLKIGSSAPGWSDHDRALLKAVEEMHANAMISDATWSTLAKELNDKQLLELPILVGQYQGVAYLQNSIRARLMPGAEGLTAK
jgi:alkylhydroperoxidase family enzyme